MARGLICRIFDHLNLAKGSVVVDPFGGIGTTGIEAASRGLQAYLCELEPRFVELAKANFELHRRVWEHFRNPQPVIVQGDSRELCAVLGPVLADVVVSSPPYAESIDHAPGNKTWDHSRGTPGNLKQDSYGTTPGNLGNMKPGDVDAIISSPPYAESVKGKHGETETAQETRDKRQTEGGSLGRSQRHGGYGVSEAQLGAMPAGNVSEAVDAIVSSPPYKEGLGHGGTPTKVGEGGDKVLDAMQNGYGAGNMGQGETFWQAAKQILIQCHAILKPGGIAVWVCKDFVRKKQRVPFSDDWRKLCEACGFTTVEWIHASLVKEDRHPGLFGEEVVKTTERKSFFRRLAEAKGSPPIDWEDVLIARCPR